MLNRASALKNSAIASILVVIVVFFLFFSKFDSNITGFFRIGSRLPVSPYLQSQAVTVYQNEGGYDGQYFLSIALDPLLQNKGTIAALDNPVYRYRRILYPLVGHVFGFGNPIVIPWVMVAINCIAIVLLVFFVSSIFQVYHLHSWQGLLTLAIPGIWLSLTFATADILSSLFLVAAIYYYRTDKPIFTSISLCLACLTRETLLLAWVAMAIVSIIERKWRIFKCLFWALIPFTLWNAYVLFRLPKVGDATPSGAFDSLFRATFNRFLAIPSGTMDWLQNYSFILLIGMFIGVAWFSLQSLTQNKLILAIFIPYLLLFSFSSKHIVYYYLDYSRVYLDVYLLFLLCFTKVKLANYLKIAVMSMLGVASIKVLLS